jgi:GTP-binding protein
MTRKLNFLGFAKAHFICALKGEGINPLMASVDDAYAASMVKMPTPKLTRLLQAAVEKQAPPRHGIFRPKLRYAHQGGSNPPIIVIHGNALDHVRIPTALPGTLPTWRPSSCKGTPLRVEFKHHASNPYAVEGRPKGHAAYAKSEKSAPVARQCKIDYSNSLKKPTISKGSPP